MLVVSLRRFSLVLAVSAAFGCNQSSEPAGGEAGATVVVPSAGTSSQAPASSVSGSGGESGRASTGTAGTAMVAGAAGMAAPSAGAPSTEPPPEAGSGSEPVADAGVDAGDSEPPPSLPSTGPLFPANGAKNVCADAPLRFSFSGKPSVGSSGKVRVLDADTNMAVATVDLATQNVNETIGGTMFKLPRPIYAGGNEVIVRLPQRSLRYGKTYYVTVDPGVVKGPDGVAMTFTDPMAWRFTTAAAAPTNLSALRVAVDGTGQFCSVQGALDAVPARSPTETKITIEKGTYFEIIHAANKSKVTLSGTDRKATVILGTNNNNLNGGTATRSLIGIDSSSEIIFENLTIKNLTPQGGSQAEALRMQNCDQCVLRHADVISLQDTLLWSGRVYATDCYIEGNVDFIWGTGAAYFDKCEIKTVGRAGYIVQARNDAGKSGYVFVDSKITASSGVSGIVLARVDVSVYPGSQVAYVDCQMGSHIAPAGWTVTGGAAGGNLRFWEYHSTDANGSALDVSRRLAGSKQITADQAMMLRNPANVLGGWTPPK